MKTKLLSFLLIISSLADAQVNSPLKHLKDFSLGMSEKSFQELIKGKYKAYSTQQSNMVYNTKKMTKTVDHNIKRMRYTVVGFNFTISKTVFDRAVFTFINNRLISIDLKKSGAISLKEGIGIMDYLHETYMKGAAHLVEKKPNKKGYTEYEKYNGFKQIYSHKPKGNRANQGYLLEFFFTTMKKSKDFTEIRFHDIGAVRFWDKYITMGETFKSKGLKAYSKFNEAYLGMYLDYFNESFKQVKKLENFTNEDNILYHYCDVYVSEPDSPSLASIPITNTYYYFYKNRLLSILCQLDKSVDEEQKDVFLEDLKTLYGENTEINKKDKGSPEWTYKEVNFEIHLVYKKASNSLIFTFESLSNELYSE